MRTGDQADEAASPVQSIVVEGTLLKVTLNDGRPLTSHDLIGATLLIDQGYGLLRVRLDEVERDPDDKRSDVVAADAIWLHRFSVEQANGSWQPFCDAGPDGRRQAIPLAGRFSLLEGRFGTGTSGGFELACTSGTMGKCVRFGYHPWQTRALPEPVRPTQIDAAAPPSHLDFFNACIRMLRADYGGDGVGTTTAGASVDLYDDRGIQTSDNDARMRFEAGWTQDGAVCVAHPRVKKGISLADIEARWPRLAGKTGERCTEEVARSLGALLFNRSAPQ